MKALEVSKFSVEKKHKSQTKYCIQGLIQEKKIRHFKQIQAYLLAIKIVINDEYILARKWLKTEEEKSNTNNLKTGSIVYAVGTIEYDFYLKENVMNLINLKQVF